MTMTLAATATLFGLMTQAPAETTAKKCAFCQDDILKKQTVYEGTYFRVLVDYAPIVEGHLLIVPKTHIATADELPPEVGEELLKTVQKIKNVFKTVLGTEQYIMLQKNGRDAGQSEPHVHFHMLPIKSARFRMFAQLKVAFKIFFKPWPLSKEALAKSQDTYQEAFKKIS